MIHTHRSAISAYFRAYKRARKVARTLGDFLRQRRIDSQLTQFQLAHLLAVSRETVNKWESNKTRPLGHFREQGVHFLGHDPEAR
ncbi:MAG: helix-turn-helix domain-containing protein [Verrucomicrobia bacterium]|nr:helix-turn-helix domain-containing protein [Verrucomicrobiota bacterium]